jgi:PAS domain S-box-containing protein
MDEAQRGRGAGRILVVDGDISARQTLVALLEREGYAVRCSPGGERALRLTGEAPPDLILLDVRLPDVDGFEVCRRLKADSRTRGVPVVFLGTWEDAGERDQGFAAGGADVITKPFHAEEVLARVRAHVALHRMQCGGEWPEGERATALHTGNSEMAQRLEGLRPAEETLVERLRFETLLSDLSAKFVAVPADKVDREIEEAERRVCEFLGLDLAVLWQWSLEYPDSFTLTHLYRPLGGPPVPERMNAHEYFPWCLREVQAGRVVKLGSVEDAPAEAARDLEVWRHYRVKSVLAIPLSAGGEPLVGVLSFHSMRAERDWPEEVVQRLRLVAEIFANALARKRVEQALRESEARLTLAAASAGAGLWELDLGTRRLWATDGARILFGIPLDGELPLDRFLEFVHPEDRARVLHTVEQAGRSPGELQVEYRSRRPDGSVRWMVSRGRLNLAVSTGAMRLMGVTIDVTERKRMEEQLQAKLAEIEDLRQQLEQENVYLREEVRHLFAGEEIVGKSDAMQRVLAQIEQVAPTDSTVLISGETGTGKEVVARAIHNLSKRKGRALITVNCASLPPSLIESELFGREKGAYTGALTMMKGRFEVADASTLFLDEVGELALEVQAKLLRALEEGRFERLGSTRTLKVDVRIIAATNHDLAQDVESGRFRRDLFYRLNVFPIAVPPLRDRPEDIPLLTWAFAREFEQRMGKRIENIPKRTMEALQRHHWPGNVRELRNAIEHAMIVSVGNSLELSALASVPSDSASPQSLVDVERRHILKVLEKARWRLTGPGGAAERLGMKRTTLQSRMKKLGIRRPTS